MHLVDELGFKELCSDQRLTMKFPEYSTTLIKMFNDCIKEPQNIAGTFVISKTRGRLIFTRKAEYKFIDLLICDFTASNEDVIQQQIMYRYNQLKSKLAFVESRLADIDVLIKVKSPSLLTGFVFNDMTVKK